MIYYLLVLLLLPLLLNIKWHNKPIALCLSNSFLLVLFLLSALRYNIGTDYINYVQQYQDVKALSFFDTNLEPVYFLFIKLTYYTTDNVQMLFILMAIIPLISIYRFSSRKYDFVIFGVFLTVMYLSSYSLIRQVAAVSILLLAAKESFKAETKKPIIFVILAACFHYSALLFLPFIILKRFQVKMVVGIAILMISWLLIVYVNLPELILKSSLLASTKYGVYANNMFNQETDLGSGLGVLLKIMPSLVFIFSCSIFRWKDEDKKSYSLKLVLWLNYAFIIFAMLSMKVHVFNRLVDFVIFVPVITVYCILRHATNNHNKLILTSIFMFLCFANYCLTIDRNTINEGGGLGISPYQSIL